MSQERPRFICDCWFFCSVFSVLCPFKTEQTQSNTKELLGLSAACDSSVSRISFMLIRGSNEQVLSREHEFLTSFIVAVITVLDSVKPG